MGKELKAILHAISLFPDGASLEEITKDLSLSLSRRTLQRRLAFLVKNKKLELIGKARFQKYRTFKPETTLSPESEIIPLSPTAKSLLKKICKPLQTRLYVSYNREFLDNYQPNKTFYLPKTIRNHLFDLGKSAEEHKEARTYAKQIFGRLLIDLSWNSSRLEGNTYSLIETKRLLEFGELPKGKDSQEAQMILNHKAAIEFLIEESAAELGINSYTVLNLHALLSDNLLSDPRDCGAIRSKAVAIEKSVYHPIAIPCLIKECFHLILNKAKAIKDPFEQAFFLMVHLPYLQPFEDVNKRVSRLAANIPLIQQNLCPLSFVDVPKDIYISGLLTIYELNRTELLREVFVWAYERSCSLYQATKKALGEPDPFRLKYRTLITETIQTIVKERQPKKKAAITIKQKTNELSPKEKARFTAVIETELVSLHEGNIARYRLSLLEFQNWQKPWAAKNSKT